MKPTTLATCLAPLFLSGCLLIDAYEIADTRTDARVEGRTFVDEPAQLPGRATFLAPFWIGKQKSLFDAWRPTSRTGLAVSGTRETSFVESPYFTLERRIDWHNALFRDYSTDEQWPLLDRRARVSRLWMLIGEPTTEPVCLAIVFAVTADDTNGDGQLDDQDATRALLVSGDGRDPRWISPAGLQLVDVAFSFDGRRILLSLREDAVGDALFDETQPVRPYSTTIDGAELATPMLEPERVDWMRNLLESPEEL